MGHNRYFSCVPPLFKCYTLSFTMKTHISTSAFLPTSVTSHCLSVFPTLSNRQRIPILEPTPQLRRFFASPTYWRPATDTLVLILRTVDRQDLRQCDWLSVDRIFEREGTWMSLKEVLVVNFKVGEGCTYRKLQPNQLKDIEASPTPCLQAKEVIKWRQYVKGGM